MLNTVNCYIVNLICLYCRTHWSQTQFLKGHSSEQFCSNPNQTHLIQIIKVFRIARNFQQVWFGAELCRAVALQELSLRPLRVDNYSLNVVVFDFIYSTYEMSSLKQLYVSFYLEISAAKSFWWYWLVNGFGFFPNKWYEIPQKVRISLRQQQIHVYSYCL